MRRMNSITHRLIPSRATAEPPSGTPCVPTPTPRPTFAEKLKNFWLPPAFGTVKAHDIAVGKNPLPSLTVPRLLMLRNVAFCVTIVELRRSNVNPPTLQRPGVAVEGLNIHVAIVA